MAALESLRPQLRSKLIQQRKRWYDLIPHPEQIRLVNAVESGVRFPVCPAGRRSGKSERAKRFVSKSALMNHGELYFCAAPTYGQVKKIFWKDMKDLTYSVVHTRPPSESDLIIFLPNGTEIHLIGLDKPERFEGVPWTGGVIDEIANVKANAWAENIYPALNTIDPRRPGYRAWCWLIGVPEGLNHYYDLAEFSKLPENKEWDFFTWKSSEILPEDIIAEAKRAMSAMQFRQEFEASFETAQGRIYSDYGEDNWTQEIIKSHEQLRWMHDQNFTPLCSAIGVVRGDAVYILDEIILSSAISRQSALEFVDRYRNHGNKHVLIYGDPAGRAGEKHGHASDYTEIENVLRENGWTSERRVKPSHPAIKDRQNSVRAGICNANGIRKLFVNPASAEWANKGLSTVQLKEGSTFLEDDTGKEGKYQHITTAIGYFYDYEFPVADHFGGQIRTTGL